jgi:hypothetical protein
MSTDTPAALQGAANDADCTDVEDRTRQALEQYLSVTPDVGRAKGADGLVTVTSESGKSYLVDVAAGRCECPDDEYRLDDDELCKHARRAHFALGIDALPADVVAAVDVDPQLGAHTDADLRFAAADGSGIIEAGDDGEVLDGADADGDAADDGRPAECCCWDDELPCWPCFAAGWETPADTEGDA